MWTLREFQSLNREVLLGLVVEDITPDEEEKFQSLIREVLLRPGSA